MKIYTKRGDDGQTDLFGGERVKKNHLRVKAYGEIDIANTAIGLAYSSDNLSDAIKNDLLTIMNLLFCAGAEIATSSHQHAHDLLKKRLKNHIDNSHILWLEQTIDRYEESLSPLQNFILPCGSDVSSRLHLARNFVRKAEIALIDLYDNKEMISREILIFFNRLSDLLFVLARMANKEFGMKDITWSGLT